MHCDICNIPAGYDDATFSVVGEGWAICTSCFDAADRAQQVAWEDAARAEAIPVPTPEAIAKDAALAALRVLYRRARRTGNEHYMARLERDGIALAATPDAGICRTLIAKGHALAPKGIVGVIEYCLDDSSRRADDLPWHADCPCCGRRAHCD